MEFFALELELTETAVIGHAQKAAAILTKLRGLGVRLMLDDFGTGYSSLSYLHQLPFDTIKIDGSFVRGMKRGNKSFELFRSVLLLGKGLDMDVIAESIEDAVRATISPSQFPVLRRPDLLADNCLSVWGSTPSNLCNLKDKSRMRVRLARHQCSKHLLQSQ